MAEKKRMGYGGLVVGISVVAMFWVTDALDIEKWGHRKMGSGLSVPHKPKSKVGLTVS